MSRASVAVPAAVSAQIAGSQSSTQGGVGSEGAGVDATSGFGGGVDSGDGVANGARGGSGYKRSESLVSLKEPIRKANFRVFIEKLNRRRKRIQCSVACYAALRATFSKLGDEANEADKGVNSVVHKGACANICGKRVSFGQLREILRQPPKNVPAHVLRDIVDVARAYDGDGDGCIAVDELLHEALDVQPDAVARLRPVLPLVIIFLWLALAPVIFVPAAGWAPLDALYFAATFVLTIGQDRVVPHGDGIKVCSVFYMLLGSGIVAWGLASCILRLLSRHGATIKAILDSRDTADLLAADGLGPCRAEYALEDLLNYEQSQAGFQIGDPARHLHGAPIAHTEVRLGFAVAAVGRNTEEASTSPAETSDEKKSNYSIKNNPKTEFQKAARIRLGVCVLSLLAILGVGAVAAAVMSDGATSFASALYWSVLTCTTVGTSGNVDVALGTKVSDSRQQVVRLIFSLIAVPSWILAICGLAELAVRAYSTSLEEEINSRKLPMDLLIDFDNDGRGICKLEFLCATLMVMDKVSAHDLWQVLDHFQRLDTDGNGVLRGDHLAMLRRRGSELARERVCIAPLEPSPSCSTTAHKQLENVPGLVARSLDDTQTGFASRDISIEEKEGITKPTSGSAVDSPSDPSALLSSSCVQSQQQSSGVHIATSSSEIPVMEGEDPTSTRDDADELGKSAFLQELCLDTKRQLEQKENELVAELRLHQQTDHSLRQLVAERQALHGEILLLRHNISELQDRLQDQQRLLDETKQAWQCHAEVEVLKGEAERRAKEAEHLLAEAERQRDEADRQRVEAERHREDAERDRKESQKARDKVQRDCEKATSLLEEARRGHEETIRSLEQEVKHSHEDARRSQEEVKRCQEEAMRAVHTMLERCAVAEAETRRAEARAEAKGRELVDFTERMQAAEKQWQLETDAKVHETSMKFAQLDIQRQTEIHGALLELQAVTHGQHVLRTQIHRAPLATLSFPGKHAGALESLATTQRLKGNQPWEMWERAASRLVQTAALRHKPNDSTVLLSGKVRDQAELLDQSMQLLVSRQHQSGLQNTTHVGR
eukprot:TRINITY_DN48556_c0_g1_i1.p1 TRINITY_DN48556_c0_g1~~TRINITY_DN48556_c0_g1_i1.p1  ORF type:complete len:1061 (-),score=197.29 TRINITY_DN48556_c0_g1_i1:137-3319(-)